MFITVVKVALDNRSTALTQLKAAMAVEIVDYLIRSDWSFEVITLYLHRDNLLIKNTLGPAV